MDVLIKGLEMPKKEKGCSHIIYLYADGTVVTGGKVYMAVPVPSHGDLIDVQEEMRLMQSSDYDTYDDYRRAFDMLDNAPTIIEASERKEE